MDTNNANGTDSWEASLRPKGWDDYVGQSKIKDVLKISIEAAKKRSSPLEHALFYGGSGLGKTSLAYVLAEEMGAGIRVCSGPSIEKAGDLASVLTNLEDGDMLFLDEAHRVPKTSMEALYSAMEDFTLHLVMGRGPMARTMDLRVPRFTLIGATTRLAMLPAPFRNRFGHVFQFGFYSQEEMEGVVRRSASVLDIPIEDKAITAIASRSRYTPRMANRLLRRVRDFASINNEGTITEQDSLEALRFLEVDEMGLEPADRRILEVLITKFQGGPAGIQALAASVGEDPDTILDVIEPYLMQAGLIERTPRGRVATQVAYKHFGGSSQLKL